VRHVSPPLECSMQMGRHARRCTRRAWCVIVALRSLLTTEIGDRGVDATVNLTHDVVHMARALPIKDRVRETSPLNWTRQQTGSQCNGRKLYCCLYYFAEDEDFSLLLNALDGKNSGFIFLYKIS